MTYDIAAEIMDEIDAETKGDEALQKLRRQEKAAGDVLYYGVVGDQSGGKADGIPSHVASGGVLDHLRLCGQCVD